MTRLCHWLLLLFLAWSCNFCHSFSLTRRAQVSLPYQLHLFSLEWSSLEAISSSTSTTTTIPYSKATRDVWKWKDTVLGDGRDYFIPRPRTLRALQQYLLLNDNDDDESMQVEECVILSNCARFEIFLVTNGSSNEWQQNRDSDNNKADILQERLSRRLIAQCRAYQQEQKSKPFAWSNLPFDRPGNIIADPPPVSNDEENDTLQWKHLDDPTAIARHVCQVAAGLAPRPSRPDRPVIFRPFSSRDAHILLQLKRTLTTFDSNNSSCRRLGQLIRIALQAGKAARNVDRVPALQKLRPYGTGDSSYSSAPPTALMEQVKEAAMQDAVEPAVSSYLDSLQAEGATWQICNLREEALALATDASETAWVKQALHAPTVALRRGEMVNPTLFLHDLKEDLGKKRASSPVA